MVFHVHVEHTQWGNIKVATRGAVCVVGVGWSQWGVWWVWGCLSGVCVMGLGWSQWSVWWVWGCLSGVCGGCVCMYY